MTTASEQHVSPLMAMLYPAQTRRCDHCGGYVAMPAEDALRRWSEATYGPLLDLMKSFQAPAAPPTAGLPTMAPSPYGAPWQEWTKQWGQWSHGAGCGCGHHHHHGHHGHECGCRECRRDDCHCRCCVVHADLVVHARLAERRLVPITLENSRRREREVKVELSDFTSRGGSAVPVTGRLLSPAEFTLGPCEEQEVLIEVVVGSDQPDKQSQKASGREGEGRLPDVDECEVAYADVRIAGCEHRSIRLAVAILPRDCHAYPVDCACGCCCC
jgi:hypothetical protein